MAKSIDIKSTSTQRVYSVIGEATEDTAKEKRLNIAFRGDNYEYLKIMAQLKEKNMTEYINSLIDADREKNADIYKKVVEFKSNL